MKTLTQQQKNEWREEMKKARHSALWEYCPKDEFNQLLQESDATEAKLKRIEVLCQKYAGHRLMQVAGPFRELLNIVRQ